MFRTKPKTASQWIARLNAGPLSKADQKALGQWVNGHPGRLKELEVVRAIWAASGHLKHSAVSKDYLQQDGDEPSSQTISWAPLARFLEHNWIAASAAAVAVIAGMLLFARTPSLSHLQDNAEVQTAVNEITNYVLSDGSALTVAADSVVKVSFTEERRQVWLERGEAFFDVRHDSSRPFTVAAGAHTVVVTGTKFDVNYGVGEGAMEVAVVQGQIKVKSPLLQNDTLVSVGASEVVLFSANGAVIKRAQSAERAAAWRTRELYFNDASLAEVVAEVNRYAAKSLVLDDPDLKALTVSGLFQAGDVESVFFSLHELYDIDAREMPDRWVLTKASAK